MPKGDPHSAAARAAASSQQRAELQLGAGRCGWLQSEPASGSVRLWRLSGEQPVALTPPGYSVRSRVHEYGGGAWCPAAEGAWFVNDVDQGIYLQPWDGGRPLLLWRRPQCRYGDLTLDPAHNRLLAVEEDHGGESFSNRLVAIDLGRAERAVIAEGADFYAAPAPAPGGDQLAWLSWDHPFQPWSGTRLQQANLDGVGRPQQVTTLIDGCSAAQPQSVLQPRYAPNGDLWLISDRSGWWNLYRWQDDQPRPMLPREAEFAGAPWALGGRSYALLDDEQVLCSHLYQGAARLVLLNSASGAVRELPGRWGELQSISADGEQVGALASDSQCCGQLLLGALQRPAMASVLAGWGGDGPQTAPEVCRFRAPDGETLHAFYYPAEGAAGRLIVQLHGGPTAYRAAVYDSLRQFWIDQGYAVLELNYRGSSGYGRAYRQRLQQQWGELDAIDACAAGHYAIDRGWARPGGLAVRGNSSGGYSVLRALLRADNPFSAGGCHYGIGDLQRLAAMTHKFESRYLDWLLGDPQADIARYHQRSPLHRAQQINTPVIFFQGGEDRVVPAEQTRQMHRALQARGVSSDYVEFVGEGHGFRRAANRAEVLRCEWAFYQHHLKGDQQGD